LSQFLFLHDFVNIVEKLQPQIFHPICRMLFCFFKFMEDMTV